MTSFRIILMFFERLFLKRLLVLSIPFKYIASFSIPLGWFNWTARGASDFFERNNEKNVLRFDLFYSIVEKNLWHFTVFLYLKIWRNILTKNMLVYRKFCSLPLGMQIIDHKSDRKLIQFVINFSRLRKPLKDGRTVAKFDDLPAKGNWNNI